jgi:glycerol-3-phosphate dehydrogenase
MLSRQFWAQALKQAMRKDAGGSQGGGLVTLRSNLSSQAERQAISKDGKQFFSSTNLNLMKPLKESGHKGPTQNLAARGGGNFRSGSGGGGGARGGSRRPPDYVLSASSVAVAGGLAAFALYDREEYSTFDLFAKADKAKNVLDERGYPLKAAPPRSEQLKKLQSGEEFDLLIIGGGATGTGMAVDAATRGLKTAMLEANDFASGTSSRSTKLAHGGVRYLEKAVKNLDYSQLHLVFEALSERKRLLKNAPHLSRALPIMTPCYKYWEVPYYWAGMKAYDTLAGNQGLTWSRFMSTFESVRQFPTLRTENVHEGTLKGSIVYYDGQFNDARLCLLLGCTAAEEGAAVANYTEVVDLLKDKETGRVCGAKVKDKLSGKTFEVRAKQVVNACGPFSDSVRKMSDPQARSLVAPSSGVHVTLPDYYSVEGYGMIVPKTRDGRVVFLLPWEGHTIAGTTDSESEITFNPRPSEKDIKFILEAIEDYLSVKVRREDVSSAWSGIRPLISNPDSKDTSELVRDHLIMSDKNGLVTICGGKWTTYRLMAEQGVDRCISEGKLNPKAKCQTADLRVVGGDGYHIALHTEIAQEYTVPHRPGAIDTRVAKHLTAAYGDRARVVTKMAEHKKLGHRLARGHPQLEAEVAYAVRYEYCTSVEDFLARRTRLAFLDVRAAEQALPRVVEIMSKEMKWNWFRRRKELARGKELLETFATGTQ